MYKFRDRLVEEWDMELLVAKNVEAIKEGVSPEKGKFECCTKLKTEALKNSQAFKITAELEYQPCV